MTGDARPSQAHDLARHLLALPDGSRVDQAAGQASEARALVITLAVVLAGYEQQIERDAWRRTWAVTRPTRLPELAQRPGLPAVRGRAAVRRSAPRHRTTHAATDTNTDTDTDTDTRAEDEHAHERAETSS